MIKYLSGLFIFFIIFYANKTEAHVRYLLDEETVSQNSGTNFNLLWEAIKDPTNISLVLGTIFVVVIAIIACTKINILKNKLNSIKKQAETYLVFTPWMLRLALGIALIGSGTAFNLVSPALSGYEGFATIQILLGFLIMAGFLVIPATLLAVAIYFYALFQDFYILGNLDFLAVAIALLILDNEKPGLDDLIGMPKISPFSIFKKYVPLVLRFGIGGAMIFLALYEKIFNPNLSELIVLGFDLQKVFPVSVGMWVLSTGIIEFVIGMSLILGLFTRVTSAIAFIVLSLSFFYFGEDVASHITLFGILAVLFITSGGKYSLDNYFKKQQS
ncbi:MAG: DoxX family protein [Candidatus Paceibacterota bacterium]